MALPGLAEAKLYLKKQTTVEDALLTTLLAQARALAESYLRRPIVAAARTFTLLTPRTHDVRGRDGVITLPSFPVDSGVAVTVTDADSVALVAGTDYDLDAATGRLVAVDGVSFDNGPYRVTATVGLSAHPDYATLIEPAIGMAILDLVADLYQRRNPAAQAEGSGGGVYTQFQQTGLPPRAREALAPWRLVNIY